MKKVICLFVIATTVCIYAADTKQDAVVEEFFHVAKIKEKYEAGMIAGFEIGAGMADLSSLPEEQQKKIREMHKKIKALMLQEMGWEKVKSDYVKLYLSVYDVAELQKVTKLLKTPTGQKMIDKEIEIIPKAMKIGQDKAKELMPKIMQMSMEAMSQ